MFGQEEKLGADGAQGSADGFALMRTEIVHDDDIAGLQSGYQHFLDIEEEAFAVNRPVNQPWRLDAVMAQRRQEGHRAPMTMRSLGMQSLAHRSPAEQWRHIGFGPGLIDEDQAIRIDRALMPYPLPASASDVAAPPFLCDQRLFCTSASAHARTHGPSDNPP